MEWDEERLHAVALEAAPCPDACSQDVISLMAEVRKLHNSARAAVERERDLTGWLREIVDAYGMGSTPEAFARHVEEPIMAAREYLAATAPQQQEEAGGDGTACADCNEPIIKDHMSAEDGHRYHLDCNPPEGVKTRLELI